MQLDIQELVLERENRKRITSTSDKEVEICVNARFDVMSGYCYVILHDESSCELIYIVISSRFYSFVSLSLLLFFEGF